MDSFMKGLVLLCLVSLSAAHSLYGAVNCGADSSWKPTGAITSRAAERQSTNSIKFKKPYDSMPTVVLSVIQLDSEQSENLRYEIRLNSVTNTGFEFSCVTWHDTKIYSLRVHWITVDQ